MALSGSDKAYKIARAGIARAGASRSNYYTPIYASVVINGTNRQKYYDPRSVRITELNRQVNTATLTVFGFVPVPGQTITIGLGESTNLLFAGRIETVTAVYKSRYFERVDYELTCVDYSKALNHKLVTQAFQAQSATRIARSLVADYVSGITTAHVQGGLATVDGLAFRMQPVSECLQLLADRIGAKWYVDYLGDLHFYTSESTSSEPEDISPTSNYEWRNLKVTTDYSQIRNRVYSKGGSATLIGPRSAVVYGNTTTNSEGRYSLSVTGAESYLFVDAPIYGFGTADRVLVDSALYLLDASGLDYDDNLMLPAQIATVSSAVAVGATSVPISSTAGLPSTGFGGLVKIDNQIILYASVTTGGSPSLDGVPASGEGSVVAAIASGTDVIRPYVVKLNNPGVSQTHQTGASVASIRIRNDATSQSDLASADGSDGIREAFREDERDDYLTAAASGDAALLQWAYPLISITYKTRDINAKPGKTVTLDVGDARDGDFLIQRAVISDLEESPHEFPWRDVQASNQRFDFQDLLARVEQRR